MNRTDDLYRRVANLEHEVAKLRAQVTPRSTADWLKDLAFTGVPAEVFEKALEYGRAIRQADRPVDDSEGTP